MGQAKDVRSRPRKERSWLLRPRFTVSEPTFTRLCKNGLRLLGRRYNAVTFEEGRPDAFCARAVADTSSPAVPPLCEGGHRMVSHRRLVKGRQTKTGQSRAHGVARCRSCRGSHFTQANVYRVKEGAGRLARVWRSPPPPRREWGTKALLAPDTAPSEVLAAGDGARWGSEGDLSPRRRGWRSREAERAEQNVPFPLIFS